MNERHVSNYFLFSNASIHVCHQEKSESLPLVWLIELKKLPTSFGIVKAVFTLYKIAFASARKPDRVGDRFTHKNSQISTRFL